MRLVLLRLLRASCWGTVFLLLSGRIPQGVAGSFELAGLSVIPHQLSAEMRYRKEPDPQLGARVQLFLENRSGQSIPLAAKLPMRLRGQTPAELLLDGSWTWHDLPSAWPGDDLVLPPATLTVWSFNGRGTNWSVGTSAELTVDLPDWKAIPFEMAAPKVWISAVTFLSSSDQVEPDTMVVHLANQSGSSVEPKEARLWVSRDVRKPRLLVPHPISKPSQLFAMAGSIAAGDKGVLRVATGKLPPGYVAIEVPLKDRASVWAHVRIKRESFDIGGGWIASSIGGSNTLHSEVYLKVLSRMHVNLGMHDDVPGYTDNPALFERYPMKYMNRCQPSERFESVGTFPRVHAVEFLGEPQYGGGRPVPPMDVWRALAPYRSTRLPTSVTHSEERIWRYYAGLSDYPHYDAYRVCAPAPDAWARYDRWDGQTVRWAAPLETIGDMTRSLRDLNRPMPIAYWSQGPHDGWDSYGGRRRTAPTPDELRLQAYHALSSRITSLYWFNLSVAALVKFRDLIEPVTRVGREMRLMEPMLLGGDAYEYRRVFGSGGRRDWDLASVTGPEAALLFALDLDYRPDPVVKELIFGGPRKATFTFRLPAYLSGVADVFRLDADGVHDLDAEWSSREVLVRDEASRVRVYVATPDRTLRGRLAARQQELLQQEMKCGLDPARQDADFEKLAALARGK